MKIVSDAGPILSFARAQRLDLLCEVAGKLTIPRAVYDEIVTQGAGKPGADEVQQASWIQRVELQDRAFLSQLPQSLNAGEQEAIALARELGGALLVDEYLARREAQRLGVRHFGSLRILKEAKDHQVISQVKPVLDDLIAAGMYLSDALYQAFLQEVSEP